MTNVQQKERAANKKFQQKFRKWLFLTDHD